jgi:hypothetical protein
MRTFLIGALVALAALTSGCSKTCTDLVSKWNECAAASGGTISITCTDGSTSSDVIDCQYSALETSLSDGTCAAQNLSQLSSRLCACNPSASGCSGGSSSTDTSSGGDTGWDTGW